tara:strand:- start:2020 stop:2976 length:957 start_codon:yes stop_codon:yes gene_type:complete
VSKQKFDDLLTMIEIRNYEFVTVTGPDAKAFLQGQVTCDVEKLSENNALAGAICNLKGRVIADFLLVLDGEDCVLRTQIGMAGIIKNTLTKYAIFSKVELSTETRFTKVLGVMTDEDEAFLAKNIEKLPECSLYCHISAQAIFVRIPGIDKRVEVWVHDEKRFEDWGIDHDSDAEESWNKKDILQGFIHISPQLSAEHTPQSLNYDLSGVIDFSKGCYTGQEIIARMYYRGSAKKRLSLLLSKSLIEQDSEVIQRQGEKTRISKILAFSNSSNEFENSALLSILDIASEESSFSLSSPTDEEQDLILQSLSYPLTDDQ